jgi:hypothetical protein
VSEGCDFVLCDGVPVARSTDRVDSCNDIGVTKNSALVVPTGFVFILDTPRPAPWAPPAKTLFQRFGAGFWGWIKNHFSWPDVLTNLLLDAVKLGAFAVVFAFLPAWLAWLAIGAGILLTAYAAASSLSQPESLGAMCADILWSTLLSLGASAVGQRLAARFPSALSGLRGSSKSATTTASEEFTQSAKLPHSPVDIKPAEIAGKTRSEIRELAQAKGLKPVGDPAHPDYPRKWNDPVTGKPRLRMDRGHKDKLTGQPYKTPNAAKDHVHAYDENVDPILVDGDHHVPTTGE